MSLPSRFALPRNGWTRDVSIGDGNAGISGRVAAEARIAGVKEGRGCELWTRLLLVVMPPRSRIRRSAEVRYNRESGPPLPKLRVRAQQVRPGAPFFFWYWQLQWDWSGTLNRGPSAAKGAASCPEVKRRPCSGEAECGTCPGGR